jgi:NAD+ kinase
VSVVADFTEFNDITEVVVAEQRRSGVSLLFDKEHNLEERIIKEQFTY